MSTKAPDSAETLKALFEKRNADAIAGEIALRDDLILKLHPESRVAFEFFCYRSPDMVAEMDCFLRLTKGKKCLLDIGALHGVFSLVFAATSQSRKVIAVDASPVASARLLYNIHINGFSNITPVESALSDESGILEMHYEWEHAVAAGTEKSSDCKISVAKRTGDELCEELRFQPDVIKIDVEGHEVKVIRGLKKVLKSSRPMVFLELHPSRIIEEHDKIDELLEVFANFGYRLITTTGIMTSAHVVTSCSHDQRLVFIPKDKT